jgi:hypothetical protein
MNGMKDCTTMRCPHCDRSLPADAVFCIYCGTSLRAAPATDVSEAPATGPTVRLDPAAAPSLSSPPPAAPKASARPPRKARRHKGRNRGDASGWIFLLGFILLLSTNSFWPGILVLIGVVNYVKHSGRGRTQRALKDLFFWGGMAFLFWAHVFWPGIILLLLASSLLNGQRHAWRP